MKSDFTALKVMLIFIILSFPAFSKEQNHSLRFERLTNENALVRSFTNQFLQDNYGNLWLAGETGITKYDGYQSRKYPLNDNLSRRVVQILHVGENQLYLLTEDNTIYHYIDDQDSFEKINVNSLNESEKVILLPLSDNKTLALTEELQLYEIEDGNINKISQYSGIDNIKFNYRNYKKINSDIFIGTNLGLIKLNILANKIELVYKINESITAIEIFNEEIVFATEYGLYLFFPETSMIKPISIGSNAKVKIQSLLNEKDQYLWIGTYLEGLTILDSNYRISQQHQFYEHDKNSLPSNSVFAIYQDKFDLIWISTDGGIALSNPGYRSWGHFRPFTQINRFNGKSISDIAETQSGDILIGTHQQGISIFNQKLKVKSYLNKRNGTLPSDAVYKIYQSSNGIIHIGHDKGLSLLDDEYASFSSDYTNTFNQPESEIIVYDIVEAYNSIWYGTSKHGLFRLRDGKLTQYQISTHQLPENTINGLYKDWQGRLWVLTLNGLSRYNPEKDNFTSIDIKPSLNTITTQHDEKLIRFNVMTQSSNNDFWIGTSGSGLVHYREESGHSKLFDENSGLANNHVLGVIANAGEIWISTNNGLSRLDESSQKMVNYHYQNGLQSNEFNLSAYLFDSKNRLFFGGINGFNQFYQDSVVSESSTPITSLLIEMTGSGKSLRYSSLSLPKKQLNFEYTDLPIKFSFGSIHFTQPEQNTIRHKLKSYDNWVKTKGESNLTYNVMATGNNQLTFQAGLGDNFNFDNSISVQFHMSPPPWKTATAYLLYVIFTLLLLYSLYRFRVKSLNERANKLEKLVEDRTTEISQQKLEIEKQYIQLEKLSSEKTRFFENLSHEFRTPLTLILGPVKSLLKSDSICHKDQQQLNVVYRNSERLMHLIDQLLEISRLNSGIKKLNPIVIELHTLIEEIVFEFNLITKELNLVLINEIPEKTYIYFDFESLQRVLLNLTSNAIKYNRQNGQVIYSLEQCREEGGGDSYVNLKITDTGIGIQPEQLEEIFERFSRLENNQKIAGTGIGLALVKELLVLNNTEISVTSTPDKGTSFILALQKAQAEQVLSPTGSITFEHSINALRPPLVAMDSTVKASNSDTQILIVDDDADMRNYIQSTLAQYQSCLASHGKEALAIALEKVPDIIISDAMMPVMDGFELVEKLKNNPVTNHIPILILTARGSRYSKIEGLKTGVDDYLTKPFDDQELIQRVDNLLSNRDLLKNKYSSSLISEVKNQPVNTTQQKFIRQLEDTLQSNYTEPSFGVSDLSKALAMSERQLQRKLKAITGFSPSEMIRKFRLNQAKVLLCAGEKVSHVCYAVGFNSLPHFSREFKEQYKVSPSQVDQLEK